MKIIGIGGIPASGKTHLCNRLGKKFDRLAIEFEILRWDYLKADLDKMISYTQIPMKADEGFRDYFLRCTLNERKISHSKFVEWQKDTMAFIEKQIEEIFEYLKGLPNGYSTQKIKEKLGDMVAYLPTEFNNDLVICSHSLLSLSRKNLHFDEFIEVCAKPEKTIEMFYQREGFTTNDIAFKTLKEYMGGFSSSINGTMNGAIKFENTYNSLSDNGFEKIAKKIKNY